MVAPVNEFDLILQAQSPRTLAPRGGVLLSPSATGFKVTDGSASPPVITIVAKRLGLVGDLVFTTSPSVPFTLNPAGDKLRREITL